MSRYFDKERFIFCNEDEAKEIVNEVIETSDCYGGKGDCSFMYSEYDNINKGIRVSYSKRNDSYDDFYRLDTRYKTLFIAYDEEYYYTNDIQHIIFPKYIVDDDEYKNINDVINRYMEEAKWNDEEIKEMRNDSNLFMENVAFELGVSVDEVLDYDDYLKRR